MTWRDRCPECGSLHTTRADVAWERGGVVEIRNCDDCPVQYNNRFSNPRQTVSMYTEAEE